MSDTLQLVVVMPSDQPDRNARPLVDLTPFKLSAEDVDDKLKRIGHSLSHSDLLSGNDDDDKLKRR